MPISDPLTYKFSSAHDNRKTRQKKEQVNDNKLFINLLMFSTMLWSPFGII